MEVPRPGAEAAAAATLNHLTHCAGLGIKLIPPQQSEYCSQIPFFFFFFCLFVSSRAAPVAHGGSQVRGQIRAIAIGLHHSHSNTGSLTH